MTMCVTVITVESSGVGLLITPITATVHLRAATQLCVAIMSVRFKEGIKLTEKQCM